MKKANVLKLVLVISVMCLFSLSGIVHAGEELKAVTLSWSSGSLGGQWYTLAGAISSRIQEKEPKILIKTVPGGGLLNILRVSTGKNDIGLGITFVDKMGFKGVPPIFKKPYSNIRSLAGIFGIYQLHILIDKKFGIKTVEDLARAVKGGKKFNIAVTQRGVTDLNLLEYVFGYYGLTLKDFTNAGGKVFYSTYADMINLYQDRHVDIASTMQASPSSAMTQMTISRDSTLLSVSDECIDNLHKKIGTLSRGTNQYIIPKGSYKGLNRNVPTVASAGEIFINKNASDILAYTITKILCESADELHRDLPPTKTFKPKYGWKDVALPLHRGAEKYYKEMGYMK